MKKTFCQMAQDVLNGRAPTEPEYRVLLQWFRGTSLYFPSEQEKQAALDAFLWLYRAISADGGIFSCPEAQSACSVRFSAAFSLSDGAARRLVSEFLRRFNRVQPVIIAVEGLDGSGKAVQTNRLCSALGQLGARVRVIDFPQYESFFGREIGSLLSGKEGVSALELDEKSMCLWYALDRWNTISGLDWESLDYLIFNRYTLSSAVYQSARKYGCLNRQFADWIFTMEHVQLGLPIPDIYIYLDTKTDFCQENVLKKERDYVDGLDVYERSQDLLLRCHAIYQALSDEIDEIYSLECLTGSGVLQSIEEIGEKVIACLKEHGLYP